jgi:hypothetical protein
MPYGDDITEGIPYVLSNPVGATNYAATGEAYDIAIAGLPFFLAASDDNPYRRVTAQYRKQQIDQTREAGEQSITALASSFLNLSKKSHFASSTQSLKA